MWQDRPNLPDAATAEAPDHPRNFDRVKDEQRLVLDPLRLRVLSHYNDPRIPVWIAEVTAALCSISPGGWTQERVKSWLHRNGAQWGHIGPPRWGAQATGGQKSKLKQPTPYSSPARPSPPPRPQPEEPPRAPPVDPRELAGRALVGIPAEVIHTTPV
jgi:hypothetical protein